MVAPIVGIDELEIVDHHHAQVMLLFQAARVGGDAQHVLPGRVVDEKLAVAKNVTRLEDLLHFIGAEMTGHPFNTFEKVLVPFPIVNESPAFPATRHLPKAFRKQDELYVVRNWSRSDAVSSRRPLLHRGDPPQQPSEQIRAGDDPLLLVPDQDQIVLDHVVARLFRHDLHQADDIAQPRLGIADDDRPVPIGVGIDVELVEKSVAQEMMGVEHEHRLTGRIGDDHPFHA